MKRGRPRLDDACTSPSAGVHLRLAATDYDRATKLAKERRESIQDLIRRGLKRILSDERSGPL